MITGTTDKIVFSPLMKLQRETKQKQVKASGTKKWVRLAGRQAADTNARHQVGKQAIMKSGKHTNTSAGKVIRPQDRQVASMQEEGQQRKTS